MQSLPSNCQDPVLRLSWRIYSEAWENCVQFVYYMGDQHVLLVGKFRWETRVVGLRGASVECTIHSTDAPRNPTTRNDIAMYVLCTSYVCTMY